MKCFCDINVIFDWQNVNISLKGILPDANKG